MGNLCVRNVIKFAALKIIPWKFANVLFNYVKFMTFRKSQRLIQRQNTYDSVSLTLGPLYPRGALCIGRNEDSRVGFNMKAKRKSFAFSGIEPQ
jgi:hypothetical protein